MLCIQISERTNLLTTVSSFLAMINFLLIVKLCKKY